MANSRKIPDHMRWMGQLIVNLQSLEFALRAFLYNDEIGWQKKTEPEFLERITEGDEVPNNAFTNFDNLKQLIEKYNEKILKFDPSLQVERDWVRIRDALAHGRIASKSPSANTPCKLVKYSDPRRGPIKVTDCYIMTKEWFDEQIKLVTQDIKKVCKANTCFKI